jgi:hypothetical protein
VPIATRKSAWRKENRPDGDRLAVPAKVNRGELSLRQAAAILGVSLSWIADMTKRYSGREGQLVTGNSDPAPEQWMPVIEGVARGQITRRAAREELKVSATRITSMLAHFRGQATDPTTARQVMEAKPPNPRTPPSTENANRASNRSSATSRPTSATDASPDAACRP